MIYLDILKGVYRICAKISLVCHYVIVFCRLEL